MKNIVIKFSIFVGCFLVSISGEAETVHEGPGPYNQWRNKDGIVTRFHIDGKYMGVMTNWFGISTAWVSGSTFLIMSMLIK